MSARRARRCIERARGAEIARESALRVEARHATQHPTRAAGLRCSDVEKQRSCRHAFAQAAGLFGVEAFPQPLPGSAAGPRRRRRAVRRLQAHQMMVTIGLPLPDVEQLLQRLRLDARVAQAFGEPPSRQACGREPCSSGGEREQQQADTGQRG